VVDSEPKVARNFTWAVLGMEDGNFWHLGGVTKWNSQIFITYNNFSRHQFCCFTVVPLFVLDKFVANNRCLQHPCFKKLCKIAQASKNSDFNVQHFLSDLLTHSWLHSMLFALSGYQFPYTVMNRCLYLIGGSDKKIEDIIMQREWMCISTMHPLQPCLLKPIWKLLRPTQCLWRLCKCGDAWVLEIWAIIFTQTKSCKKLSIYRKLGS
jgi:hypothetical protein